jgi:uncharacterized repeat protein (TIGR01451 family)
VTATATDPSGNTSEFSFKQGLSGENFNTDLAVTQIATPDPSPVYVPFTFTVSVSNLGPNPAYGVTLSNELPSDSLFIDAVSAQGNCSFQNDHTVCQIGTVPVSGSVNVDITIKSTYEHTLENTVVVSGHHLDPDSSNNAHTLEVEIIPNSDLSITKTADQETVPNGGTVTYTLDVANLGPSNFISVKVVDTLPAGFSPVSADSRRADCSISGNTITCDFQYMYIGDTNLITIVATVEGDGSVINTAEIMADVFDSNMDNNSASAEITIGTQEDAVFADSFEEIEQ